MSSSTRPSTPPSTPKGRKHLTRDEKVQIRTLRDTGMSQIKIAERLGISRNQVQYALSNPNLTPKRRSGRPPLLTTQQVDELEKFVRSSSQGRQISFLELSMVQFAHWGVTENVIAEALHRRGYSRRIVRAKHPQTTDH